MRILYISSPSFADCDFPLIKEFQKLGHDITYLIKLTPYSLKSTLFNIEKQLPFNDIIPASMYEELSLYSNYFDLSQTYIINRTSTKDSGLESLKMSLRLYYFIKNGKFDVIHSDIFFSFSEIILYRFRNKLVQTFHDPLIHSGESSFKSKIFRTLAVKNASKIILLNENQRKAFVEAFGIDDKRVFVNRLGIYDCINVFNFNKSTDLKTKKILFFGRISPYKGIEYLVEAMMNVHERIPESELIIAGGGKLYFDFSKYKNVEYITLINRYVGMDELANLLYESQVVVCPYTDATQSGVVMTAFAMNKPVIATNVGGMSESISDNHTGLLIAPKDVLALADAIVRILSDDSFGKRTADFINSEYYQGEKSWKSIVNKYVKCYTTSI